LFIVIFGIGLRLFNIIISKQVTHNIIYLLEPASEVFSVSKTAILVHYTIITKTREREREREK